MIRRHYIIGLLLLSIFNALGIAQQGEIENFAFGENDLSLKRLAQPGNAFNKVGKKFAILGSEGGSFEAWAYPIKLFRDFQFSFLLNDAIRPIPSSEVVKTIETKPEATTLTFVYQSFTVKAHFITPVEMQGAIILLEVDAVTPFQIICSFLPVLQPMWPAGLGGQYAYWDEVIHAYVISESTRKNIGLIGSPAAKRISSTLAHMLSENPNSFSIDINEPYRLKSKYIPIIMVGGKGDRNNYLSLYKELANNIEHHYQHTFEYYNTIRKNTLRIDTPNDKLDKAFEWAKISLDNLIVENPDLGKGMIAGLAVSGTSGRPGFGWFFGGDTYINSLSVGSYCDFQNVRDIIVFMRQFQREDGKMAHEISQAVAYIDWFKDYPYGYIHGDTTPFYISAVYEYLKISGDVLFVEESWESLQRAFEWCLSTDKNGDGLMDNGASGLTAVEFGEFTGGIETDIYLAAVWMRATEALSIIASILGRESESKNYNEIHAKSRKTFEEKFWDENEQQYAFGFNSKGEHVNEISPWHGVCLMWNYGSKENSIKTLQKLCSSKSTTDWGIRIISTQSNYYNPLNYNYGTVWPFLSGFATTAQFKHHLSFQAFYNLLALSEHTFSGQLGTVHELFSGANKTPLQQSVAHQGFSSAGIILPLVRGLLGLEGDAVTKQLTFAPHFPPHWNHVNVENFKIGEECFNIDYLKHQSHLKIKIMRNHTNSMHLKIAPTLGGGSKVDSVVVDGKRAMFSVNEFSQVTQPVVSVPLNKKQIDITIYFKPTVELIPPKIEIAPGSKNKGLKMIVMDINNRELSAKFEGLGGARYTLEVLNPGLIREIEGAVIQNNQLFIQMPEGETGTFIEHGIKLKLK